MITPYFAGDIVLSSDAIFRVTDSGGGDTTPLTLKAGSWFAHGGVLLEYMIYKYNATGNGGSAVTNKVTTSLVNSGNGHADNGKISLSWSGGATLTFSFGTTEVSNAVGYGSTTSVSGLSSAATFPNAIDEFWEPSYPVLGYERSSSSTGGYTATTLGGGTFSLRGNEVNLVGLTVNIGYSAGYAEWRDWTVLWTSRWLLGRSVCYIPDPTSYSFSRSAAATPLAPYLGRADSLSSTEASDIVTDRLMREKDSVFTSGPYSMVMRPANSLFDGGPSARSAYYLVS